MTLLIEDYLPVYHFKESHSIKLVSPNDNLYKKMLECDFSKSLIIRLLYKVRGIPTKLCTIEDITQMGFLKLAEKPGEEIIFGMVTDSPMFKRCQSNLSPSDFITKSDTSIIKAVINFNVKYQNLSNYIVSTETRIWCGSKRMKSKFKLYWFFVKPFSQIIRRNMLKQIKLQS
jgi:hypothetical protein